MHQRRVTLDFDAVCACQAGERNGRDGPHCNQFHVASDRFKRAEVHGGDGLLVVGVVKANVKVFRHVLELGCRHVGQVVVIINFEMFAVCQEWDS